MTEILVEDKKIARNYFEKFGSKLYFNEQSIMINLISLMLTLFITEIKKFIFFPRKFECKIEFEEAGSARDLMEAQKSLQFPMKIIQLQQEQPEKPNPFSVIREGNEFPVINMKSSSSSKKMSGIEMLSHDSRSDVNTAKQELESLMRKQAHTAEER